MRSLKTSCGAAAWGSGSARSASKSRSGMGIASRRTRSLVEAGEEPPDHVPDLGAPGQAAPMGPDQADQLVTLVDRGEVGVAGPARPVHQQGLDVGLERAEDGVVLG